MKRYQTLLDLINTIKPQSIVEVGSWNGDNAVRMITEASKYHEKVSYIGYDLFEEASDETDKTEFNVKPHHTKAAVEDKIRSNCPNAEVLLIKGNTNDTLKSVSADFTFIDGGHSVETIQHDYNATKGSNAIVFDDYYVPDEHGRCPDLNEMGCNRLVDSMPAIVTGDRDPIKGGGYTALALIGGVK